MTIASKIQEFTLWYARTFFSDERKFAIARKQARTLNTKGGFIPLYFELAGDGIKGVAHVNFGVAHFYERRLRTFQHRGWSDGSRHGRDGEVSGTHDPRYLALALFIMQKVDTIIPKEELLGDGIHLDASGMRNADLDWGSSEPDAPSDVMYWRAVYEAIHNEPDIADYIYGGLGLTEALRFHAAGIDAQLALSTL